LSSTTKREKRSSFLWRKGEEEKAEGSVAPRGCTAAQIESEGERREGERHSLISALLQTKGRTSTGISASRKGRRRAAAA